MDYDLCSKSSAFFNDDRCIDPFDMFNMRSSPKSDDVFRYKTKLFEDKEEPRRMTCVTYNTQSKACGVKHGDKLSESSRPEEVTAHPSTNAPNEPSNKVELDTIIAPFRKTVKSEESNKVVRRDVVNKTIFRIIRRFFHSTLEKHVPDYKKQKKANLMNMLSTFSEFLFKNTVDSTEIAEVLSALMFRREMLLSAMDEALKARVQVFLDIQSKYTHKLLYPALENKYFRVIFNYFIQNGSNFLLSDENVKNCPERYLEEFEKIKEIFFSSF